jgi:FkbM family methyltransferase
MTLISYAQNGEDVVLWRALRHVENGFYIDVGACDPDELSVTRVFYDRGWSGINVEPSKEFHDRCVAERPRDLNLNVAVMARAGIVRFLNVPGTGLSTTLDNVAASAASHGFEVEARDVPALSLADICASARTDTIHFLKIDVEGGEQAVLEGADFRRFRPWIVLVEATVPLSTERNDAQWRDLLLGAGYEQAYFDGVNLYFVAEEHRELAEMLAIPPNALDDYKPVALHESEQRVTALSTSVAALEARLHETNEAATATHAALEQERAARAALEAELATERQALEHARAALAALEMQSASERAASESQWAKEREALESQLATERSAAERERRARGNLQTQLEQERRTLEQLQGQSTEATAQLNSLGRILDRMAGQPRYPGETLLERLEAHLQYRANEAAALNHRLEEALHRHQTLLASTSWRVTAPLRQTRRMIQPKMPQPQHAAPVPPPPPGEPRGKELARRIFHRSMYALLQMPGARQSMRLVHGMAPAPVEWLALRYRAYDRRATELPTALPVVVEELQSALAPEVVASLDMSDEETRLYRQFMTGGLSLSTAR